MRLLVNIYYNILTYIDVLARLIHFTRYTPTFHNRMIQRSLHRGRGIFISEQTYFSHIPQRQVFLL